MGYEGLGPSPEEMGIDPENLGQEHREGHPAPNTKQKPTLSPNAVRGIRGETQGVTAAETSTELGTPTEDQTEEAHAAMEDGGSKKSENTPQVDTDTTA